MRFLERYKEIPSGFRAGESMPELDEMDRVIKKAPIPAVKKQVEEFKVRKADYFL